MPLTVRQLREHIADLPDDATVEIAVRSYHREYPVHYGEAFNPAMVGFDGREHRSVRLSVSLPENIRVSVRKSVVTA